jgi:uroporphyrinogen-III synthase
MRARPSRIRNVVITRPVGLGRSLARALTRRGFVPLLLPGSSLRAVEDAGAARQALQAGLRSHVLIFTSPAAVRFAGKLASLDAGRATTCIAVGAASARALARAGVHDALVPSHADSEGVLALPGLQHLRGRRVAIIGAAGGRELLAATLRARGAHVDAVHVYRRVAPRWNAHHLEPLRRACGPLAVLLTSADALARLQSGLPPWAWAKLRDGVAVSGSARLDQALQTAGFTRRARADSALAADLIAALERI